MFRFGHLALFFWVCCSEEDAFGGFDSDDWEDEV
jgi:hypothetical protein